MHIVTWKIERNFVTGVQQGIQRGCKVEKRNR